MNPGFYGHLAQAFTITAPIPLVLAAGARFSWPVSSPEVVI